MQLAHSSSKNTLAEYFLVNVEQSNAQKCHRSSALALIMILDIISASPPQMLVNISSSTRLFPLQKSNVQLMEEISMA